jgi:allantoicase
LPFAFCLLPFNFIMVSSFLDLIDLASEQLGASVVAANDDFFAPKENLIRAEAPRWREGEYTDRGKWMDGWETRRRREPGFDWCIVRLGVRGIVRGLDVDTAYFKGNYPEACALDGCDLTGSGELERAAWSELLPRTPLAGDTHNLLAVETASASTHIRLRIFPDGGVARLRVYGDVTPDWDRLRERGEIDLAAVDNGGVVVGCSDMFFGSRHNLIMPGDPRGMADGWETKRRRGPGHDWTIVRLGAPGAIRRIVVDTRFFKGNAPGWCSLDGAIGNQAAPADELDWRELMPRTPLRPDTVHTFEDEVRSVGEITHARLNIFPDGGVARLRLFGQPR